MGLLNEKMMKEKLMRKSTIIWFGEESNTKLSNFKELKYEKFLNINK